MSVTFFWSYSQDVKVVYPWALTQVGGCLNTSVLAFGWSANVLEHAI